MRSYSTTIYEKLLSIKAMKVDKILLLEAGQKVKQEIPFDDIVAQYKYCLDHNITGAEYEALVEMLERVYDRQDIESARRRYGNKR